MIAEYLNHEGHEEHEAKTKKRQFFVILRELRVLRGLEGQRSANDRERDLRGGGFPVSRRHVLVPRQRKAVAGRNDGGDERGGVVLRQSPRVRLRAAVA